MFTIISEVDIFVLYKNKLKLKRKNGIKQPLSSKATVGIDVVAEILNMFASNKAVLRGKWVKRSSPAPVMNQGD